MWIARSDKLTIDRALHYAIDIDARPATFAEVIRGWQSDAALRSMFSALLAAAPFGAFRWETPPVDPGTVASRPFEFVLLDSPGLTRRPDPEAFAEHFPAAGGVADTGRALTSASVVTFPNLGGDAIVVPCPIAPPTTYGHLAAFVREAPEPQRHSLWQAVGDAMAGRVRTGRPVWLSTAGAGVSWLHVRLDDRPKYYGYDAYRRLR